MANDMSIDLSTKAPELKDVIKACLAFYLSDLEGMSHNPRSCCVLHENFNNSGGDAYRFHVSDMLPSFVINVMFSNGVNEACKAAVAEIRTDAESRNLKLQFDPKSRFFTVWIN